MSEIFLAGVNHYKAEGHWVAYCTECDRKVRDAVDLKNHDIDGSIELVFEGCGIIMIGWDDYLGRLFGETAASDKARYQAWRTDRAGPAAKFKWWYRLLKWLRIL